MRAVQTRVFRALVLVGPLVLFGCGATASAPRDGQIVFVPPPDQPLVTDAAIGAVGIDRCEPTEGGLRVMGSVQVNGGVVGLIVDGGEPGEAGVAVAASFAVSANLAGSARGPGDFIVTLPWAAPSSTFRLVDPDSLGPGQGEVRVGTAVPCP